MQVIIRSWKVQRSYIDIPYYRRTRQRNWEHWAILASSIKYVQNGNVWRSLGALWYSERDDRRLINNQYRILEVSQSNRGINC